MKQIRIRCLLFGKESDPLLILITPQKKTLDLLTIKEERTDPLKINNHYANVGPNIDKGTINVRNTFFLSPVNTHEIFDIILSFDNKISIGPNSISIYFLKISNITLAIIIF